MLGCCLCCCNFYLKTQFYFYLRFEIGVLVKSICANPTLSCNRTQKMSKEQIFKNVHSLELGDKICKKLQFRKFWTTKISVKRLPYSRCYVRVGENHERQFSTLIIKRKGRVTNKKVFEYDMSP